MSGPRGITRQSFLLGAAALGLAASAAGRGATAALAHGGEDHELLYPPLDVARIQARLYELAPARVKGMRREVRDVVERLAEHEAEHAERLRELVEGLDAVTKKPAKLDFGDAFASEARFLALAERLEQTGVASFNHAAEWLDDAETRAALAAMAMVQARHAAAIRLLRDRPATRGAFDRSLDEQAVARLVRPFKPRR